MNSSTDEDLARTTYLPDLLYSHGRFKSEAGLLCDSTGHILGTIPAKEAAGTIVRLKRRVMLPGLVNAHSHAFQRLLRGRTEHRTAEQDTFWTWREMMYRASTRLTPEDVRDSARFAFLEMALNGITAVGEFHYLHRAADGQPYDDPNLLSKAVIDAANGIGLRIALLRVAYARSGHGTEPNEGQLRFIEADPQTYLRNTDALRGEVERSHSTTAWVGVAPHSVRALPLAYLREISLYTKSVGGIPIHMHIAEQPAEVHSCLAEHGRSPVELLHTEGILSQNFTAVHAIHISELEAGYLAQTGSFVCACPTTERNLGDGIVPARRLLDKGVPIALGTDSQVQIDLLEDARELEYHLRLERLERAVLSSEGRDTWSLAAQLFECASINGARSIQANSGVFEAGFAADFFTIDLDDPSIAGTDEPALIAAIVFGAGRSAIRDVFVGGKQIVVDGRHPAQHEAVEKFSALQHRLWS